MWRDSCPADQETVLLSGMVDVGDSVVFVGSRGRQESGVVAVWSRGRQTWFDDHGQLHGVWSAVETWSSACIYIGSSAQS